VKAVSFDTQPAAGTGTFEVVRRRKKSPADIDWQAVPTSTSGSMGHLYDGNWFIDILDTISLPQVLATQWATGRKVSLTGERVTPGSELTKGMAPGWGKAGAQFVIDVVLDPLNLLALGPVKAGVKAVTKAVGLVDEAGEGLKASGALAQIVLRGTKYMKKYGPVERLSTWAYTSPVARWVERVGIPLSDETRRNQKIYWDFVGRAEDLELHHEHGLMPAVNALAEQEKLTPGFGRAVSHYFDYKSHIRQAVAGREKGWYPWKIDSLNAERDVEFFSTPGFQSLGMGRDEFLSLVRPVQEKADEISRLGFDLMVKNGRMTKEDADLAYKAYQGAHFKRLYMNQGDMDLLAKTVAGLSVESAKANGSFDDLAAIYRSRATAGQVPEWIKTAQMSDEQRVIEDARAILTDELARQAGKRLDDTDEVLGGIRLRGLSEERHYIPAYVVRINEVIQDAIPRFKVGAREVFRSDAQDTLYDDLAAWIDEAYPKRPPTARELASTPKTSQGWKKFEHLGQDTPPAPPPVPSMSHGAQQIYDLMEAMPTHDLMNPGAPGRLLGNGGKTGWVKLRDVFDTWRQGRRGTIRELKEEFGQYLYEMQKLPQGYRGRIVDFEGPAGAHSASNLFTAVAEDGRVVKYTHIQWDETPDLLEVTRQRTATDAWRAKQVQAPAAAKATATSGAIQMPRSPEEIAAALKAMPEGAVDASTRIFNERIGQPGRWVTMPDSKTWGSLAGKPVPHEIYWDLMNANREPSAALEFMAKVMTPWRIGATILNPVTHARNFVGNILLTDLGGNVSPLNLKSISRGIADFAQQGKYWEELPKHTRQAGGYITQELGMVRKELRRVRDLADAPTWEKAVDVGRRVVYWAGDKYGQSEALFKHIVYVHAREKGMTPVAASKLAEDALFNYQQVPYALAWLRRSGIIPFPTFTYKSFPVMAKALVDEPYKLAAYARKLPDAIQTAYGVSPAERRRDERKMPPSMREADRQFVGVGEGKYINYGAFMPYQSVVSVLSEPLGNTLPPMVSAVNALATNKDRYGRPIMDENASPLARLAQGAGYGFSAAMPGQYRAAVNFAESGFNPATFVGLGKIDVRKRKRANSK